MLAPQYTIIVGFFLQTQRVTRSNIDFLYKCIYKLTEGKSAVLE